MSGKDELVFLGAGQMAEALVRGLLAAKVVEARRVRVTDVEPARLDHFARIHAVAGLRSNAEAASQAETIVLAVKPQVLRSVCEEIRPALAHRPLIVSIAAGVRTSAIEGWLGESIHVVRAMPNTPAKVGYGITAIAPGRWAEERDLARAEQLFRAVGLVVRVREEQMDAVTAVSGSGPAYVFYLAEAMLAAASSLGLEPAVAEPLVRRTILGAGQLLEAEPRTPPEELRRRVTSKGGTTEAAVRLLDEDRAQETWIRAIRAAASRARELSGG